MQLNKSKHYFINIICITILYAFPTYAFAAERITLFKNIFSKSINVEELEEFIQTDKASGFLNTVLKNQDKSLIKNHLTKEHKAPIQLTSRLLNSQIGEVILKRISKIVYPYRIQDKSIGILALKAATIKAIDKTNESINLINFIKSYPSEVIAIDVTELGKVLNKVESTSELIKFFTDSPLENLKSQQN